MSGETAAPRLLPGRRIKLWRRRVTPVGRLLPAGTLRDDVGLERGERVSVPGGLGTQPREAEAPPRLRSRLPGSGPHDPSPAPPPAAALRLPGSGRHRARPLAAATGGGVCLQRDGVRRWAPLAIQLVQGTFTPRSSPLLLCPPRLQSGRPEYKSPQRTGVRGPQSRPVPYPDSSSSWRPYDPRRSTLLCVPLSTTTPWHPPCAPAESKVTSVDKSKRPWSPKPLPAGPLPHELRQKLHISVEEDTLGIWISVPRLILSSLRPLAPPNPLVHQVPASQE